MKVRYTDKGAVFICNRLEADVIKASLWLNKKSQVARNLWKETQKDNSMQTADKDLTSRENVV